MITLHRCEGRLILLMIIGWGWVAESAAQPVPQQTTPPPSLLVVCGRVPLGAAVHVTDSSGSSVKGSLFALTVEAVQVQVGKELHTVSAGDVRRIQWQQPDSRLTGPAPLPPRPTSESRLLRAGIACRYAPSRADRTGIAATCTQMTYYNTSIWAAARIKDAGMQNGSRLCDPGCTPLCKRI